MIRAGLAEGRIPKDWVAEFTKYARATSFNDRFMSGVPDPDKWTEQREQNGRIEYSPLWEKMLCLLMGPLVTDNSPRVQQQQPGQTHKPKRR